MKKGKLAILLTTAAVIAGGVIIASQKQSIFSNDTQSSKQLSAREKQLAYLREHEKDMTDFVKSLSPKVKSVQFDWECGSWSGKQWNTSRRWLYVNTARKGESE